MTLTGIVCSVLGAADVGTLDGNGLMTVIFDAIKVSDWKLAAVVLVVTGVWAAKWAAGKVPWLNWVSTKLGTIGLVVFGAFFGGIANAWIAGPGLSQFDGTLVTKALVIAAYATLPFLTELLKPKPE